MSLLLKLWKKLQAQIEVKHFVILTEWVNCDPVFKYKNCLLESTLPPFTFCKHYTEAFCISLILKNLEEGLFEN